MNEIVEVQSQETRVEQSEVKPLKNDDIHRGPPFKKNVVREYFESAVVTLIMALFGMTFIVQAVKVPTGSMQNTIYVGDHLLVNKFVLSGNGGPAFPILPSRQIKRGDIVVFKYPSGPETNYVKRVIGLPGDTVEFNSETNRVYINGEELPEHRVQVKSHGDAPLEIIADPPSPAGAKYTVYYYNLGEDGLLETFTESSSDYGVRQPFKVPIAGDPLLEQVKNNAQLLKVYDADEDGKYDADQYFCMGDNRDNSLDSRAWGTVPRNHVVGRAMFVYWSLEKGEEAAEPKGNPVAEFFTRTLWSRTGKFIK